MSGYVGRIEARSDALDLVRAGVRLPYVRATTGLPNRLLRELWRDVYGECPSSGRTHGDPVSGLRSGRQRKEASTFANLYFAGGGQREVISLQARRFIEAWALFHESSPEAGMDANLAWAVIRNLCAHLTWREKCRKCGASFIRFGEIVGRAASCPFCAGQ